jgi:hypothetical protein
MTRTLCPLVIFPRCTSNRSGRWGALTQSAAPVGCEGYDLYREWLQNCTNRSIPLSSMGTAAQEPSDQCRCRLHPSHLSRLCRFGMVGPAVRPPAEPDNGACARRDDPMLRLNTNAPKAISLPIADAAFCIKSIPLPVSFWQVLFGKLRRTDVFSRCGASTLADYFRLHRQQQSLGPKAIVTRQSSETQTCFWLCKPL